MERIKIFMKGRPNLVPGESFKTYNPLPPYQAKTYTVVSPVRDEPPLSDGQVVFSFEVGEL